AVGIRSEPVAVRAHQRLAQVGNRRQVGFADQQLVRARTPVVPDGRGFTAPDELRSAQAEALPATPRVFAGPAVARAVPAFHRQHAEPVADAHAVDIDGFG